MDSLKGILIFASPEGQACCGTVVFPQRGFLPFPSPCPAPSAALLHIPAVISHPWLWGAEAEGREPVVAAAPAAKQRLSPGTARVKTPLKENCLCLCFCVVNTPTARARTEKQQSKRANQSSTRDGVTELGHFSGV